jgi:hypothetical protein
LVISDDATSERRKTMSKKITILVKVCIVAGVIAAFGSIAQANWTETFGGNAFDQTWAWGCFPDVTKTFTHTIKDGPDNDDYLSMDETTVFDTDNGGYGSAFGIGFVTGAPFTNVRVGAIVNVTGDASHHYCGFGARASYFIDPDGSITGVAPGLVASAYVIHIDWQGGPANLSIDIEKVVNNQNIMRQGFSADVPGLNNARSYYAVLDVLGSNPTYVTGYLYEYEGGPLVAKTGTLIDTNGNDPWEDPSVYDAVFTTGLSGVFAQNERVVPPGYHTTFDTVSSVSDGPAAAAISPADGTTGVSIDADLSWAEAAFATGRELYFGKAGSMKKVAPSPAGKTYDPGTLEFGKTYQWQVNEIGPGGTVEGAVWAFTTEGTAEGCLLVEGYESYVDDWTLQMAWPDNIDVPGVEYIFLETSNVYAGGKAMRLEYQNQYEPYVTAATHTFTTAQDWTSDKLAALSLYFRGQNANVEQKLYVQLEDALGHKFAAPHPFTHAGQSESWNEWNIELSDFSGVNLAQVKKITIGVGDGTNSGQPGDDRDSIYIDEIRVCPPRCFNTAGLDLRGDVDGNCRIDFNDFADMAAGWLNDGLSVVP